MSRDKAAILSAIKRAEQATHEEQRLYREVIKTARTVEAIEDHLQLLETLGWEGVCTHMSNECFPPSSNDWRKLCGISWDQTPKHEQLQQITDEDIRRAVYHFSELAEQTERIKAAARFYEFVGAGGIQIDSIFAYWVATTLHTAMGS